MGLVRTFREAVMQELSTDLSIRFEAGKISGPVEHGDLGCAWALGFQEDEDNVAYEDVTIMCRVFLSVPKRRGARKALDPGPLEDLVDLVQLAIKDKAGGNMLGPWYARVTSAVIDLDEYGVEFSIVGKNGNVGLGL